MDKIFELRDVTFSYEDGTDALVNCSIEIPKGSFTAILGSNGSGKTTLLLHLNGLFKPRKGLVLHNGHPIDYSRAGLRKLREGVGLVFQNPDTQLFSASVKEDVSFGPMNIGLDKRTVKERVDEAVSLVGISDLADKPVRSLSYGQKKRVCIAGVLAMQPEVILLDEPMSGLDIPMQKELIRTLTMLHSQGKTIVIATHDIDFAYQYAESIYLFNSGRCTASWNMNSDPFCNNPDNFWPEIPSVLDLYNTMCGLGILKHRKIVPRSNEMLKELLLNNASKLSDKD